MRPTDLSISESDLLGWIEGDLPADRRDLVDRALAAQPDLHRALVAMAGDAAGLRALGREATPAPAGLVARALAIAEREALTGAGAEPVVARIGPVIRTRFAVAAAVVALFGGSWFIYQASNRPTRPRAIDIAATDALADLTDSVLAMDVPDSAAPSAADAASLAPAAPDAPAPSRVASLPPAGMSMASIGPAPAEASPDAYDVEPVSESVIASMLPLRQVMDAMDRAGADLSQQLVTLEVLEGQPRPVSPCRAPARVSPASTQEALMMAGMNRLGVRVQARDPETVDRAIRAFAGRVDRNVRVTSQALSSGAIRYIIETDRDPAELNLLVAAIQNACDECARRTFFDASLTPQNRGPFSTAGLGTTPRLISSQRVRVPVTIEPIHN